MDHLSGPFKVTHPFGRGPVATVLPTNGMELPMSKKILVITPGTRPKTTQWPACSSATTPLPLTSITTSGSCTSTYLWEPGPHSVGPTALRSPDRSRAAVATEARALLPRHALRTTIAG